jgi:hypothetical protein
LEQTEKMSLKLKATDRNIGPTLEEYEVVIATVHMWLGGVDKSGIMVSNMVFFISGGALWAIVASHTCNVTAEHSPAIKCFPHFFGCRHIFSSCTSIQLSFGYLHLSFNESSLRRTLVLLFNMGSAGICENVHRQAKGNFIYVCYGREVNRLIGTLLYIALN